MTPPTPDQIQDFLDDLAALTAAHGLVLDGDVGGYMSLDPLPDSNTSYGGYVATLRGHNDATGWWEIGVYEAGLPIREDSIASIDITRIPAHRRLALRAALERVRAILRGGASTERRSNEQEGP
jgi:hypothetical protein